MSSPWLSVLIPVYNVTPYLADCLRSVLDNEAEGVEVLMLDDCSTDGSEALAAEWVTRHPERLRLLHHDRNRGLSGARNTLLEAARGDYLWFLDSDDVLMPGAVASLRRIVQRDRPELVVCDFRTLRERFGWRHQLRGEAHVRTHAGKANQLSSDRDALVAGLMHSGYLHSWSKIARRSVWGDELRFPEGRYFEDMATTPGLLLRAHSHVYVDEVWVGYRQRPGSILAGMNARKIDDMMAALSALPALAGLGAEARFQASFYAAKTFILACRFERGPDAAERRRRHLRQWLASTLLAPAELLRACLAHGWAWRAARLAYWWRLASTSDSKAS